MNPNNDIFDDKWPEYLEAWFSGEADEETQQALQAWRKAAPENEQIFRAYEQSLQKSQPAWAQQLDVEEHWQAFRARVQPAGETETGAPKGRSITWRIPATVAAAASVLLLLTWWFMKPEVHTLQVADGQQMVWLPDSSQVLMNEHTRITYEDGFGKKHRDLTLEGQAFFEVTPNKEVPFRIKSQDAITQVVGTSFDLQSYPEQPSERLTVITGLVQYQPLRADGKPAGPATFVKAGQSITYNKQAAEVAHNPSVPNDQLRWSGRLVFQQSTLADVLEALESYYHVRVALQDATTADCLLTASFHKEKLQDVLDVIALSMDMEWEQQGDTYLLKGNGCN